MNPENLLRLQTEDLCWPLQLSVQASSLSAHVYGAFPFQKNRNHLRVLIFPLTRWAVSSFGKKPSNRQGQKWKNPLKQTWICLRRLDKNEKKT